MHLGQGIYLDRGACIEKIINKGHGPPPFVSQNHNVKARPRYEVSESDVSIGTLKQPKHPEATQPRHDGVGPKR